MRASDRGRGRGVCLAVAAFGLLLLLAAPRTADAMAGKANARRTEHKARGEGWVVLCRHLKHKDQPCAAAANRAVGTPNRHPPCWFARRGGPNQPAPCSRPPLRPRRAGWSNPNHPSLKAYENQGALVRMSVEEKPILTIPT